MFAGFADYGVYQRCCREIEGKSSRDLVWLKLVEADLGDPLNHVHTIGSVVFARKNFALGLFPALLVSSQKIQGQVHTQTRHSRLLSAISCDSPQQEPTTTTTSSTNYPANHSRWVTPLVFVQALAYVLHRVNRCRGRRDMVWDVEMLTVCEIVCLLAGFPQEGYDRSVHLPAPVQVSRKRARKRIWGERHLTSASGSVTLWTSRPTVPSRRGKFPQRAAATNLDRIMKS